MASKAIHTAKKLGRCRANATSPKMHPVAICVNITKNFLVLYISRSGLQRGFSVHGNMMMDVQKAICASLTSSPLNISVHTMLSTTNGIPMAK